MCLKGADRIARDLVVAAGNLRFVKAQLQQALLQARNQLAGISVFQLAAERKLIALLDEGRKRKEEVDG